MKQFFFNIIRKMKVFLLILLLILIGITLFLILGSYSDGSRAGTIIKFSNKGVVFKTYEGELNLGMVIIENAAANYGSNIFYFTVPSGSNSVLKTIDSVMLTGNRVKLFYKEKYIKFPWVGDSKYLIYKVEVLKN
jgi:hypothetical protein